MLTAAVDTAERCTSSPSYRRLAELCDVEGWHLELARYGTRCSTCAGDRVLPGSSQARGVLARLAVEQGEVVDCRSCRDQQPLLVLELWPTRHGPPITCRCTTIEDAARELLVHAHRLRYARELLDRYGE